MRASFLIPAILAFAAGCGVDQPDELDETEQAVSQVTVQHISWGTLGLDSNSVTSGPNTFPVGVRITNSSASAVTNLTATFSFTTTNANINLDGPSTVTIPSIAAGASADAYFNVVITRTTAAYNTSRGYQISVSGTGFTTQTAPTPREIYVEKLVSQNRNAINGITGPTSINVGDTVTYTLDAATATGGYAQVSAFLTLPTNVFRVLSTTTTYTSPTGGTNDKVYADACGWDPVPTSATYRSCIGPVSYTGGKAGGTIHTVYTALVIGTGSAGVTAAIQDFSGSSYHYNSDYGTVTSAVTASSSPPTATGDSYTTAEDTALTVAAPGVLSNDTDPQNAALTAVVQTQPAHGTLSLASNGSFTYTPAANYNGADSFTYKANNGSASSSAATVSLTITAVNDAPVAAADTASVAVNAGATAVAVLANDSDVDGDSLTITAVTQPANGTVVITGGGSGLTFQPAAGFSGTTSFTYTISDGHGGTATATVTMTVSAGNSPPVAVADSATVLEDAAATSIAVLGNDSDPDGDALTITAVTQPANGTVVITGGGTGLTFQPAANANGTATFTYTISDGKGGTATATVTVTITAVNDPPTATADTATVAEDSAATAIDVLANDSDPDGDAVIVTAVTQPANGTVLVTTGGTGLTFQPAAGFSGTTSFTYTISDGNGGTATATVTVTVTHVNHAPAASDDSATLAQDSPVTTIDVLANDSDADGDSLAVTAVTQPANGTVTLTSGVVGFLPAAGFYGTTSFTYTITDGHGGTATGTVTVTVTQAVNHAPVATDDSFVVSQDASATVFDVLGNDSDADGDALTITSVTQPANGTVTFQSSQVSFQPATGFHGTTSFTYSISDGRGGTATATVTVTVTQIVAGDHAPVATDDAFTVAQDSGATPLDVLANDSDVDGDPLAVVAVTQSADGTVTFTSSGVAFQPTAGFSGATSFTYTISDGRGGVATATVAVNVTQGNHAPVAADDAFTVSQDSGSTTLDVLGNDSDADGDALAITAVTQPADGTVTLTNGVISFAPTAGFYGTTSFTYSIADGHGGTATATVTVTVTQVVAGDHPPVATDDSLLVDQDAGATVVDVLANDTDADGDPLTVIAVTQSPDGTVTLANGVVTFQPAAGFYGTTTFTYSISDGKGGIASATVGVFVSHVNHAPSAAADTATVSQDSSATAIDVLGNDRDPDGDALAVTAVTQPANGTVTFTSSGVSFQPAAGFFGTTSFTYTVSDGHGGTATATVTVTVTQIVAGDHPPVASDDAFTVAQDSSATAFDVLANDSDLDGDALAITAVTQATHGTVSFTSTGVLFQPAAGFFGTTSFTYTISDGRGGNATATVTVTVTKAEANHDPIAWSDAFTVSQDSAATVFDVLANDTDIDGDTLVVTAVTQPANGAVTLVNGVVGFTPAPGFFGTTSFTYTISDGHGGSASAAVTVTVTELAQGNHPPVAGDDAFAVAQDSGATALDVLANDSDPDGDALTITSVTQAANGTVSFTGTSVTFQPAPGFFGTTSFTYTVSDGRGGMATATVTVTVAELAQPDHAPVAGDDAFTVAQDADATVLDVLANDHDVDGDPLTITSVTQPSDGTVTLVDGVLRFQPAAGFHGTTTFTYSIFDGRGGHSTATVTVTVDAAAVPGALDDGLHVSGGGCQASNGQSGLFVVLGLGMVLARRRRRAAAAVVAAAVSSPLLAAADDVEHRDFSVERFALSSDRNGLFNVEAAESGGAGTLDAAFALSFEKNPLVVYRSTPDDGRMVVGALVASRTTADLVASFAVTRRLSLGLDLPLVLDQGRPQNMMIAPGGLDSLSSYGLANIGLTGRWTVLDEAHHGIGVALLATLTLPTESKSDAYFGDHGVSAAPAIAVTKTFGPWHTGVNLGYLARQSAALLDLVVDDEVFVRAGVGYDFSAHGVPVGLGLTASAATEAAHPNPTLDGDHLETLLGATYQVDPQVQMFAGAGIGLAHGFGTPDDRVLVGVRLTREPERRRPLTHHEDGIAPAPPAPEPAPSPEPAPAPVPDVPAPAPATAPVVEQVALVESVYFKLDSATIEPGSYDVLDRVADVMTAHPAVVVEVAGHTDNLGTHERNVDLSLRRSRAVIEQLVKRGIAPDRLQARGYAETAPVGDNQTVDGRAQNRRVVFIVIGNDRVEVREQGADASTRER